MCSRAQSCSSKRCEYCVCYLGVFCTWGHPWVPWVLHFGFSKDEVQPLAVITDDSTLWVVLLMHQRRSNCHMQEFQWHLRVEFPAINQLLFDLNAFTCNLLGSGLVSLLLYVNNTDCPAKMWYVSVLSDHPAENTCLKNYKESYKLLFIWFFVIFEPHVFRLMMSNKWPKPVTNYMTM